MKLVRESLNEFGKGNNPLSIMGLGALSTFHDIDFKTYEEWADYTADYVLSILKLKELPDDFAWIKSQYIGPDFYDAILKYLRENNITVHGLDIYQPVLLLKALKEKGIYTGKMEMS